MHRRSAEIGYWLAEPYWGRGIATRALRAFADYAFATFDLVRLYGTPFEWNPASARVLEKAGFAYEGLLRQSITKDGRSVGAWMYGLVRDPDLDHPAACSHRDRHTGRPTRRHLTHPPRAPGLRA